MNLKIKVPATSANLGPGFDALGVAINLHNEITIKSSNFHSVSIKGEGEHNTRLKKNNIFISIFNDIYQELSGEKGTFRFEFTNKIPFARGLGSSSAVIVSAIASAYEMANIKVSKNKILNRALFYEPHPDNIAPCVYGGFVSSVVDNNSVHSLQKTLPEHLKAVMVIPNKPMSTVQSRSQLPKKFAMQQVVYNLSRASLLSAAFFSENWEMLKIASKDCIHQDQRMKNMPELKQVQKSALEQGALMSTLSGSGSSFFSMCYETDALGIKERLNREFQDFRVEIFDFDNIGYVIEKNV
ncbi:homoserine kinase [Sulfurospirillum sp. 1612]|uniref:homoserine kinase n=1 Tax=Sulfurospirillum sp. 1612 TaxID=3094835 RepID=UPI002F95A158